MRTNKDDSEIGINVTAGRKYFVLLVVGASGFFATHILSEVDESQAFYELKRTAAIQ